MVERDDRVQRCTETLSRMLSLLGLDARIETQEVSDRRIVLELDSSDAGRIIGRKGQTLECLEMLLNRVMHRGGAAFPNVLLQVRGYSRRDRAPRSEEPRGVPPEEEERLRGLALDAAKEVKRWGDPKELGPFTARQRRIIHLALKDDPDVETVSGPDEGQGQKRITVRLRSESVAGSSEASDSAPEVSQV